jgi:nitrite reductase/ring-hydroxylating ferredoxin subunit
MSGWLDRAVSRIERAERLDRVADAWAGLIEKPLQKSGRLRGLLSGSAFGHPIHPLLVTAPIGAFVAASALDLAGEADAARRLIGLGLVSAVPTAATGGSDWVYTTGAERRVGFVHAATNWLALGCYATSWQLRRRGRDRAGAVVALAGGTLLSAGGWLGGHLVYARGVGIDTTAFLVAPEDWQDTVAETELADDVPTAVEVGGVPVVLVRHQGEVYALDDRCSHRGGPLHEGEVADGCLRCPWHDSAFRLADGSVATGPATRPQRRWQVRRRYGVIQVRGPAETGSLRTNVI